MAYFIPHSSQSNQPKAKVEGFHPNLNPPSPGAPFDPSFLFNAGPMFPDAFRNPTSQNNNQMDFDTLMSLMPQNTGGGGGDRNPGKHQGQQQAQSIQQQQQQPPPPHHPMHHRAASLNLNIPSSVFEMSHFPGHLSSFGQQQQPQQHRTPRDDALDSPASMHTTQSLFDPPNQPTSAHPAHLQHNQFTPSSIPAYINGGKADTPPMLGGVSPSDSPSFPTHAAHARIHGHRSPSIGPNSASRSRSRGGNTSRPPPPSRNGVGKAPVNSNKRQSLSSTPDEPSNIQSPPPTNGRPTSILIPNNLTTGSGHAHHLSHEFTTHQLNSLGPHPISPLGIHSTQTAPGWFIPSGQSQQQPGQNGAGNNNGAGVPPHHAVESGAFGLGSAGGAGENGHGHSQGFSQAFVGGQVQPRSLSLSRLASNPKPGTSASASVLAGNLNPADLTGVVAMDAASKQYVP